MINFLKKKQIIVFFVVYFLLWLISQKPLINTIIIQTDQDFITVYLNNQKVGTIPSNNVSLNDLKIDFENNNLPRPNILKPQVVSIKHFNNQSEAVLTTEIKLKNTLAAEIRFNETKEDYHYLRFTYFREREAVLGLSSDKEVQAINHLSLPLQEALLLILRVIISPFPYLILFFLGVLSLKNLLKLKVCQAVYKPLASFVDNIASKSTLLNLSVPRARLFLTLTLIFLYLIWVNVVFVEKIPHTPDSVHYLWKAKYLAAGRLWLPLPQPADAFVLDEKMNIRNNRWIIAYPFGHPLILIPGVLLGMPWVIPPLIGVLALYLIYRIIAETINPKIAYPTMLVFFFSPFFQMQAVTFMSHNTAVFYLLLFLYTLLKIVNRSASLLLVFFGGVSFGLFYQTRLLSAFALTPAIFFFLLNTFKKERAFYQNLVALLSGGLTVLLLVIITNQLTFGNPLISSYLTHNQHDFVGGASGHTWLQGLTDSIGYLLVLQLVVLPGLPLLFSSLILLSLLSLFSDKRQFLTVFGLGSIIALAIGWMTYGNYWGLFLGSRFWYEMMPFIFILLALAFDSLIWFVKKPVLGYLLVWGIVLIVALKSFNGWVLAKEKLWEKIPFTPKSITEFKGFNFTDPRLLSEAKRQKLNNALILVKHCDDWWCYGLVMNENTISLDGSIVWAKDLGAGNSEIIRLYPGRRLYFADYEQGTIIPVK